MPVRTTVHIEGLQALGEAMRGLSSDVATRVSAQATNAGAQVIRKKAKQNIESSPSIVTRSLLNSVIVKKIPKTQTQYTAEYIVTVRGRGKKSKKTGITQTQAPHAHFIEFGTVNMPAEPFLGPAYDTEKQTAVDAIAAKLKTRIDAVKAK